MTQKRRSAIRANNPPGSLLAGGDGIEQAFQTVQRRVFFGIERFPKIINRVRDGLDGARESRAAGVGVAAALEFFGDFQGLTVAAAETDDDDAVSPAKQSQQNGVGGGFFLEQLMDDQIVVAD